jgi:hypothetical protein
VDVFGQCSSLSASLTRDDNTNLTKATTTAYKHAGNLHMRKIVADHVAEYSLAETRDAKSTIVTQVVREIERLGRGFVTKRQHADKNVGDGPVIAGRWNVVSSSHAREKITQAFRDLLQDRYKSSIDTRRALRQAKRKEEFGDVDDDDDGTTKSTGRYSTRPAKRLHAVPDKVPMYRSSSSSSSSSSRAEISVSTEAQQETHGKENEQLASIQEKQPISSLMITFDNDTDFTVFLNQEVEEWEEDYDDETEDESPIIPLSHVHQYPDDNSFILLEAVAVLQKAGSLDNDSIKKEGDDDKSDGDEKDLVIEDHHQNDNDGEDAYSHHSSNTSTTIGRHFRRNSVEFLQMILATENVLDYDDCCPAAAAVMEEASISDCA